MTNEPNARWTDVDAIFEQVIALDPELRRAFISRASNGDPVLEREVMALLDSLADAEHEIGESADSLLQLTGPLVDSPEPALPAGSRLGSYRIERELGRGGMGAVYLAQRVEGDFEREVAIKVMRRAHDSRALLRRFAGERRILGALEHPHIARLYESGITPDGRPYLVMERVAGQRIDRWADQHGANIAERLTLFIAVCEAVAYAHERLIVHRDLKPANVLVSASGHVTLLDFGIAKLLDGAASALDDPATRPGQLVLTPEYASPEQARGEAPSVAMDIFALGVLLHELLTGGRPPWQRMIVSGADIESIESAMVPPSRSVSAPQRARALRGELDTVVLTALAPARERRYASVQALRDDVIRARAGYPILAQRPSLVHRANKFIRRNPLLSGAAALLLIVTAAFTINTNVQARQLTVERDRADGARVRAERTAAVLREIFGTSNPFTAMGNDTLRASELLARGAVRVDEDLRDEPSVRADLLLEIGRSLRALGQLDAARRALDTAIALRERDPDVTAAELVAVRTERAHLSRDLERFDEASALYQSALRERERSLRDSPIMQGMPVQRSVSGVFGMAAPGDTTDSSRAAALTNAERVSLSSSLASVGSGFLDQNRLDSAQRYLDSALLVLRSPFVADSARLSSLLNVRATLATRSGDMSMALEMMRQAYTLNRARFGADDPNTVRELGNIGFLLDRLGRSQEAVPLLREALQANRARLPADHPAVRSVMLNLGGALSRSGARIEAEQVIRDVVAMDRTRGDNGARALTMALDNLAGVLEAQNKFDDAESVYREVTAIGRRVSGDQDPGAAIALSKAARLRCTHGEDVDSALAEFEQSLTVLDRVFPPDHGFRLGARGGYGVCLIRAGRRSDGEALVRASFDAARRGSSATHGMARMFGGELLKLYTAADESAQRALLRAQLDSLAPTPRPPS